MDMKIAATITSQGKYADSKDICELYVAKKGSYGLPHKYGEKIPIELNIGDILYEAGVHETKEGVVWISSVLYRKDPWKTKTTLVDALSEIGLQKGDRVNIRANHDGTFSLNP